MSHRRCNMYQLVTAEEMEAMINSGEHSGTALEVYDHILSMVADGYFVFHDNDTDRYFAIEEGKPVPEYFKDLLLQKGAEGDHER